MDKDFQLFDPARAAERLIEPELLAMQRAARDLERERDAATAREAVAREALRPFAAQMTMDPHWEPDHALTRIQVTIGDLRKARAALATPSPAAEALLELAEAAETLHRELCRWLNLVDLPIEVLAAEDVVNAAVEKWQWARG